MVPGDPIQYIHTSTLEGFTDSEEDKIIITWSYGYLHFLNHLDQLSHIKAVIALAPTQAIIQSDSNPNGWPKDLIDRMVQELTKGNHQVLQNFYRRIRRHFPQMYKSKDSLVDLCRSLTSLSYLDLGQVSLQVPLYIFHGQRDKLLPVDMAYLIHKNQASSQVTLVEEGHFILNNTHVLRDIQTIVRRLHD